MNSQHNDDLVAYLDGELDHETSRRVEEALRTDENVQQEVRELELAWDLLDELPHAQADEAFTQSTVKLIAVEAEDDLAGEFARRPRRRKWLWLLSALGCMAAGFFGVTVVDRMWPNPDEDWLRDLPVIDQVDQLNQADNLEFLRKLKEAGLFAEDAEVTGDGAESKQPEAETKKGDEREQGSRNDDEQ